MTSPEPGDRRATLENTTRFDPTEVEARIFSEWIEGGYFHPAAEGEPEENFSVAIPPPNVTGALHMGHALNGSIQDTLVRKARMGGANALWVLGTDHAGIATQSVVEKKLRAEGISRHDIGREAFVEKVWEWKAEYGSQIVGQYKRLGASCDYDRERFTLDDDYVRAVYKVFTHLYDKGYIYRDNYMVNWDPGSRSAISDLEVVNREVADTLFSIDYPVEDSDEVLTVATVRPETMMADTAVAVNPDDERFSHLVGKFCILPLVGRRLPIIADEHVEIGFGTGALKITPGHDTNDFEIGRRHGLEEISVIGEDGRMTDEAGERFTGLTVAEAQVAVVEALREEGRLRDSEPYVHSVPFSERSGERIEPLISLQWFCRMDELAAPAIQVVEDDIVRIVPDNYKRVYLDWMRNIRPWCVSRQLWWGHRLPVWYRGGEDEGSELETYVGETAPEGDGWRQETDVLDTWFSSALWPFATQGWPPREGEAPGELLLNHFYPTNFLTTAREILFLWVARMVMMSIEFVDGKVPFHDVYVHPVIQAPDGRRMSKSLGTGVDPLDEIDVHGADALRFGLLAMSSTQDVRFSADRVQQGRDLANKMWNASRLILLNVDATAAEAAWPGGSGAADDLPADLAVEDRWILSRLESTIASVTADLDAYDFAHASLGLYEFFFSELCDWYLEMVKPRLYEGEGVVSAVLLRCLRRVLALAHPMMPFVTEEIYTYLRDTTGAEATAMLVSHPFPVAEEQLIDEVSAGRVAGLIDSTRAIRRWRDLVGVSPGTRLAARAVGDSDEAALLARLARLDLGGDGASDALAVFGPVEVLGNDEIDAAEVERRLEAQRAQLRAEVSRAEGKLGNSGFVDRAPIEVVEAEREKLERYRTELAELG